MSTVKKGLLAAATLCLGAGASAHHSGAMYDGKRTVTLTGTVKEIHWTNPHAWLDMEVQGAKGSAQQWNVELPAPQQLVQQGFRKTNPRVGDKVTVIVHPIRDGRTAGAFVGIKLADGKIIGAQNGY
jgi:Family of unknown function (DUF6152)